MEICEGPTLPGSIRNSSDHLPWGTCWACNYLPPLGSNRRNQLQLLKTMTPWVHSSTRRHCLFSEGTEETAELIPKAQRLPEISDSSPNFVTAGAKADQRSAAGRGASGTQTGRFKMVTELHCLDIVGILPGLFAVKSCNLHWPGEPGWRICQGKGCWYDPGLCSEGLNRELIAIW